MTETTAPQQSRLAGFHETRKSARLPFARFQFVDVTFDATDTDQYIEHTLKTRKDEAVRYLVVATDKSGVVYNDESVSRRPWGDGYIILRCATTSTARLLLFVEQTA